MAVAGTDTAAAPLLLLFDIDGTLLSGATSAHSEALHEALHEVHGINTRGHGAGIDPAGRTDGEIARLLLLDAGVSALAIDEGADAVRRRLRRGLRPAVPAQPRRHRHPGHR